MKSRRYEFKSPAPTLESQAWLYMPVTPALEDEDRWILGVGWLDHLAKIRSFRFGDTLSQKSKVGGNKGRLHTSKSGFFMCTHRQAHLHTAVLVMAESSGTLFSTCLPPCGEVSWPQSLSKPL